MSRLQDTPNADPTANFGAMLSGVLSPMEPLNKRLFRRRSAGAYAFSSGSAVSWLTVHLALDKNQAQGLLALYFDAHLLYSPTNRTLNTLHGENVELHPTAKGFAYLERWYTSNVSIVDDKAAKIIKAALESPYNSLKLLVLERSLLSRRLLVTTGLAMVVWMRLLGKIPHTYNGQTISTQVGSPGTLQDSMAGCSLDVDNAWENSPHFHRQMIHPNSCCHFQYWNAEGIRIFRDLRFEKPAKSRFSAAKDYKLEFVVSGHSILQWIMDCTSVESTVEGMRIARLLLSNGFLKKVSDPVIDVGAAVSRADWDPVNRTKYNDLSTKSLYRFTPRGRRLCVWEDLMDDTWVDVADVELEYQIAAAQLNAVNSGCSSDEARESRESWSWEHVQPRETDTVFGQIVTMALIQCEPSLKLLFREELERRHSSEPLMFVDKAHRLLLLISASYDARSTVTRRGRLETECNELLSRVVAEFIVEGAPFELNISEADRTKILTAAYAALADPQKIYGVAAPLVEVKTQCVALLRDALTQFNSGNRSREVPGLRDYVVAKYSVRKSPCLLGRRGAVHTINFDAQLLKDAC